MNIKEVEPYSQYIGDAVYLIDKAWDGYHYWLITTDGIDIHNKIALDHGCVFTLVRALKRGVNNEYSTNGNILG